MLGVTKNDAVRSVRTTISPPGSGRYQMHLESRRCSLSERTEMISLIFVIIKSNPTQAFEHEISIRIIRRF